MEVEFVWNLISFGQCGLSVRDRVVEFVWNLISFGQCGLSVRERCLHCRGTLYKRLAQLSLYFTT